MAQQSYRANVTAAEFPFLSEFQGRTIIMPGLDQNYSRQASSTKNKDRDIGIPQAYYMHNMIPTDAGLSSVAYQNLVMPPLDTDETFTDMFKLRDTNENFVFFVNTSSGRNYVLPSLGVGWLRTTDMAPAAGKLVTTAHVNGQSYIYFGGVNCYRYDVATNALVLVVLAGLAVADILGICASNGYMIAWDSNSIKWSSLVSPIDFVPSLSTGAGGQGVQIAKASIVVCLPLNNGFIVYTKTNAIAQIYTGNAQYPFSAKEIIGAGGVASPNLVSYDGNSTNHYAYTTAGLQEISLNNSAIMAPAMTDFISGAQFEDYDEASNVFTVIDLAQPMVKKLTVVANRYVVFSYGVTQLTHALMYDIALGRWGKFKITHVDCFEYQYPSSDVVETPRRSIGFLQKTGAIQLAILAYSSTGSYGTVILGKYQLDRNHYLQMQEIHLESVKAGNTLIVKLLTSIDGVNNDTTVPVLASNIGLNRRYNCRATGLNHSIVISGAMNLNSFVLKFSDEGEVR